MNPDVKLRNLRNSIEGGRFDDALRHADSLIAWLDRGGLAPRALAKGRHGDRIAALTHIQLLRGNAMMAIPQS